MWMGCLRNRLGRRGLRDTSYWCDPRSSTDGYPVEVYSTVLHAGQTRSPSSWSIMISRSGRFTLLSRDLSRGCRGEIRTVGGSDRAWIIVLGTRKRGLIVIGPDRR